MSIEVFGVRLRLCAFVFLAERLSANGQGFSQRSSECEPKGNLHGFLARLHAFPQNEGKEFSERRVAKEVSTRMAVSQKSGGFLAAISASL